METTIKKGSKASSVNFASVQATISKIEQFVKDNGYQFKDRTALNEITEENFNEALRLVSKKRKKLANHIWSVNNHPTLENVNKFFWFLMKNIMKSESRIKVIKSDKEIAIQEKRKAYKEALAKMQAAYADYKTEKGDFYKIKLANKQTA